MEQASVLLKCDHLYVIVAHWIQTTNPMCKINHCIDLASVSQSHRPSLLVFYLSILLSFSISTGHFVTPFLSFRLIYSKIARLRKLIFCRIIEHKFLSTSNERRQLLLTEALALPFLQSQDKHPIKGQANCAKDTFTVTDKSRRGKLPHLALSVSHYLPPLRHCPIFQNNGYVAARENCTIAFFFSLITPQQGSYSSHSHPISVTHLFVDESHIWSA